MQSREASLTNKDGGFWCVSISREKGSIIIVGTKLSHSHPFIAALPEVYVVDALKAASNGFVLVRQGNFRVAFWPPERGSSFENADPLLLYGINRWAGDSPTG